MASHQERNTTRRMGWTPENCSVTEQRTRSVHGTSGQLFGRRHAAVVLAVITSAHFLIACSAITCESITYEYGEGTPCKGKSFRVRRCAKDVAELEVYLASKELNTQMSPNNCKRGWLLACANFHGSAVVVPKSIKCNDVMCDRSSLYSNCVEDADCASNKITSVNDFEPDADLWPFNPFTFNPLNTTLPTYSPCCNFYEKNCNGAVCARADSCPIDVAKTAGWCKDEDCWVSSAWAPSSSSALLSATLAAVTVLAASLRGLD